MTKIIFIYNDEGWYGAAFANPQTNGCRKRKITKKAATSQTNSPPKQKYPPQNYLQHCVAKVVMV